MDERTFVHREDEDDHGFRTDLQDELDRAWGVPENVRDPEDYRPVKDVLDVEGRRFHPLAPSELQQRRLRRAVRPSNDTKDAA